MPVTPFVAPLTPPAVAFAPATVVLALALAAFFAVLAQEHKEKDTITHINDRKTAFILFIIVLIFYL